MIKSFNIDFDPQDFENIYIDSIELCKKSFIDFIDKNIEFRDFKSIGLSLLIVSDIEMIKINTEQRGKTDSTDVLSFPIHEDIRNNKIDFFLDELNLGDIVISKDTCIKQAYENNINFLDEFIHLLTHGFLHLLGYDHEISDEEDKLMRSLESAVIDKISQIKKGL